MTPYRFYRRVRGTSGHTRGTGFTLVETVVIIAMYAVILIALANLFTTFSRLYRFQQSFVASAQSAGASMAAIHESVIPANEVLASYAFSTGIRSSGPTALVLSLPSVDGEGRAVADSFDRVAFYADGSTLYRVSEPAAASVRPSGTKILTDRLESISFTYDDASFSNVRSVEVDLVASTTVNGQSTSTRRHEQLYLRN